MSKPSSRERAEEVRRAVQLERVTTLSRQTVTALADPDVPARIKKDDGTVDDGTVNKDALENDLDVVIEQWYPLAPADSEDLLQLMMATVDASGAVGPFEPVGEVHSYNESNRGQFPVTITVPKAALKPDGKRQLRYSLTLESGNTSSSNPIPLTFDSTPPWGDVEPTAVTLPSAAITDAYLSANPTGIEITLPSYADQDVSDVYALYYSNTKPVPPYPDPLSFGPLPLDRKLLIPKAEIENRGDGQFFVVYLLIDKATNRSRISEAGEVVVNLGTLPTNLQDPVVPLAADGLVDLADAQAGITVEIPAIQNHRPTDLIEVTWGSSAPFTEQIGSRPFPLSIFIPHDRLLGAYGKADTVVETPVSYRVLRYSVPYGPKAIDVDVDFSVIGPPRPDPDPTWPDPVNVDLLAPVVKGEVSDTQNELQRSDAGKDAILTFTLYPLAKDAEIVDFYWDGTLVKEARYTVIVADGPTIERTIPWSYILNAGNNSQLPVHYTIRNAVDVGNEQRSVSARVKADAVTEIPPLPQFQRLFNNRWLNCDSLWEDPAQPAGDPAFRVSVMPLAKYLPQGGKVTMLWTLIGGRTGDTEIVSARKEQEVDITPAQAAAGFHWDVEPYATHILPAYDPQGLGADARGRVAYSLEYKGETIHSETAEALVGLGTGAGTCVIP